MAAAIEVFVVWKDTESYTPVPDLYRNAIPAQRAGIDADVLRDAMEDPGVEFEDANARCSVAYVQVQS